MTTPATLVLLRFDEQPLFADVPPADEMGSIADLNYDAATQMPPVVSAFTGYGRQFGASLGLFAADATPGASLSTRDLTVRAILSWDFDVQNSSGTPGVIVCRGKGASAPEYVAYALELRVVNAAARIGEVRFWWQDIAGAVHVQQGGQFVAPASSSFFLVTAVRHWVSSTQVEMRYYVGDQLVGEILSSDGSIGGATTGTFSVGARYSAGVPGNFLRGVIDELQVLNYELTAEEIAATWQRLVRDQPRGYATMRQLFQPGAPIADAPSSRVQKLIRIVGHALGYATAQIANFRDNTMPDRAYGPVLSRWERIAGVSPGAGDTVVTRRRRAVGQLKQRAGSSVPGVAATLAEMLRLAKSQVQVMAFGPEIDDPLTSLQDERWWTSGAEWAIASGALGVTLSSGDVRWDVGTRNFAVLSFDRLSQLILQVKLNSGATLPVSSEAGLVLWDFANGAAIFFGLRQTSSTVYKLTYQRFEKGVFVDGSPVITVAAGVGTPTWLRITLAASDTPERGVPRTTLSLDYSTTSATAGFANAAAGLDVPNTYPFAGLYARSTLSAIGGGGTINASFNDLRCRITRGTRAFDWYVYRDPALIGSPDLNGANVALGRLRQAHTRASVITSKSLLCDAEGSVCDLGCMGGI